MDSLNSNLQDPKLSHNHFVHDDYFQRTTGKLTAEDLPLSMFGELPLHCILYIFLHLSTWLLGICVKNRAPGKERWKYIMKILLNLKFYLFGIILLDIALYGLHEVFHQSYTMKFEVSRIVSTVMAISC